MRDEILSNLHNPGQLEKLYRANKNIFKQEFSGLYPQLSGNVLADCWHERLHYESEEISWGTRNEFLFVVIAALVAGILAKLPAIFSLNEEFFYSRNIGFLVFPFVAAYFAWKNKLPTNRIAYLLGTIIVCTLYINWLPDAPKSDTLVLACIHMALLLWGLLGISFTGQAISNYKKRLEFFTF